MLKNHIKIATVLIGIVTAAVITLSVVPQMYKTSVFLAQGPGGPGGAIPPGLPAPILSMMLQTVSSGIKSSMESGSDIMQKLSYIPLKNSVFKEKMNKIYDTITEAETSLAANETELATNAINYLQQLAVSTITSYAETSEGKDVKKKMGEDLAVIQNIISAADGWVKSYDGDKSAFQEDLTAAKASLAASNAEFSKDKFPEAVINFANIIGSLVELLPVVAPDTAVDELNFVYEKASALGLGAVALKARVDSSSNAKKTPSAKKDSNKKIENVDTQDSGLQKIDKGIDGGGGSGGGSDNKGKLSSKDKKTSTSKDEKKTSSKDSKKDKSTKVKKTDKDSSCNEEELSSKDKKTSSSKDKKKTSSKDSKKDKSSKVKKTDKDSSCDEEKLSSKDKGKSTSKNKKKSSSKDKKKTTSKDKKNTVDSKK